MHNLTEPVEETFFYPPKICAHSFIIETCFLKGAVQSQAVFPSL